MIRLVRSGLRVRALAGVSVCGLLLTACGGGDSSSSEPAETVTATVTESATDSSEPSETTSPNDDDAETADDGGDGGDGGSGASANLPPKPPRDECVEIQTPGNGRYTVYEAGTAVVKRDGGRLRIANVSAAQGWRARVTDRGGDDDVEIEFRPRQRGVELELEVEIDDGRVESKICADDDDNDDDDDD